MFRKEDICDVNKRIEWWDENALFVSNKIEKIIPNIIFSQFKDYISDIVNDVLLDLLNSVWGKQKFNFNLSKIPDFNSFDDLIENHIHLLLTYTYGQKYKTVIIKKLENYIDNIVGDQIEMVADEAENDYYEHEIIDDLCCAIETLRVTSNKMILLGYFRQDKNKPVLEWLKSKGKSYQIEKDSNIGTLYKMNAMFRMCLILDINECMNILKIGIQDIIKHAYLTKTEKDKDLHRADKLYKIKKPNETKRLRIEGGIILKNRFHDKKFDSILIQKYSEFFRDYAEDTIREGLRLEKSN